MLRVAGYCSGSVDGWYGHSTARAVMLFQADTFQEIGYGKKVSEAQWKYLVDWVGERCSDYDEQQEDTYRRRYPEPQYPPQFYQYKY